MDATVTLSRKERRKALAASDSLPVVVSDDTDGIEGVNAADRQEAHETAPTASLPMAPVATTGSLPIAMPDLKELPADGSTAELPGAIVSFGSPITFNAGIDLREDGELAGVETETSSMRSVKDIMEQEGVSWSEASLIWNDERLSEGLSTFEASLEANRENQARREAKEAEQAEAVRIAEEAKAKSIRNAGAAEVISKQAKRRMLVSLAVGLFLIAGFFVMGGF